MTAMPMLDQLTTSSRGCRLGRGHEGSEHSRFLKIKVATTVTAISPIVRTQSGGCWIGGKMISDIVAAGMIVQ